MTTCMFVGKMELLPLPPKEKIFFARVMTYSTLLLIKTWAAAGGGPLFQFSFSCAGKK